MKSDHLRRTCKIGEQPLELADVAGVDRLQLHPNDGAAVCMAASWPMPATVGSRNTATRFTPGEIFAAARNLTLLAHTGM